MAAAAPRPADFSSSAIEQVCQALADAVTGAQIPNLIAPLGNDLEPADDQGLAKWKRLFNAVADAQNRLHDGRPLMRLLNEVIRPVRSDPSRC
jgi:hypothetical protein